MFRISILGFASALAAVAPAAAADFSFFSTLQAGQPGTGVNELGVGASPGSLNQGNVDGWGGWNHWLPTPFSQQFRIGYNRTTDTAYVMVFDQGTPSQVNFVNPGPTMATNAIWTLPAAGFFAAATGAGSGSITVDGLSFSSGVTVLSGSLPASLGATGTVTNSLSTPIQINATAAGGSWYIEGTVRFSGISSPLGGGASGSQLAFGLNANGSDTPEAATFAMLGAGLVAIASLNRRKLSEQIKLVRRNVLRRV